MFSLSPVIVGPLSYFWLVLAHFINEYLLFSIKGFVGRINIFYWDKDHRRKQKGMLLDSRVPQCSSDLKSDKHRVTRR